MRKVKRKGFFIVGLIIVLFISCFFTACSSDSSDANDMNYYKLTVKDATNDFYVNDFANLFTEEQKADMMTKAVNLNEEYSGIQVVITTVNSFDEVVLEETKHESFDIEQVAYSMFSQYGIGQDDMGILILFSVGDREVRIETGIQMQTHITDSISGQIVDDYGMVYFVNDQFAEGLISMQSAVIDEIQQRVPKDWKKEIVSTSTEIVFDESVKENVQKTPTNETTIIQNVSKDNNSENGLIVGIFASIAVCFATVVAFIRKIFTHKTKLETQEKKRINDLTVQEKEYKDKIRDIQSGYETQIVAVKRNFEEEQIAKMREIGELKRKLSEVTREANFLRSELETQKDKFTRAQNLHPEFNFENEIQDMIESEFKEAAFEVDSKLTQIFETPADKDNIDIFKKAISLYDTTDIEVKKYVTSDIQKIHTLYNNSVSLKEEYDRMEQEKKDKAVAKRVCDEIREVYTNNPKGNYETYKILNSAYCKFTNLTTAQVEFFPDNDLIQKLKWELNIAEKDYKDFNAAREAENEIESIVSSIYSADEDDRDRLERAMRYYRNLNTAQQSYFSDDLLRKLKRLISDADDDHRRQEARRRERRMQTSSSYNRSSYGGGFSGHGGRPSGGGASRRF